MLGSLVFEVVQGFSYLEKYGHVYNTFDDLLKRMT